MLEDLLAEFSEKQANDVKTRVFYICAFIDMFEIDWNKIDKINLVDCSRVPKRNFELGEVMPDYFNHRGTFDDTGLAGEKPLRPSIRVEFQTRQFLPKRRYFSSAIHKATI